MEFKNQVQALTEKIKSMAECTSTEEATKNAFVMPFISLLGYDVFNPMEVVPEFTADVGTKKGEKVDYAILRNSEPIILFECKSCGSELSESHAAQLYRYFSVTKARFGILTNGIKYKFYTDLEEPNKMDPKPFLEFDFLDLSENTLDELKRFSKNTFDVEETISAALDLKYTKEIKILLEEQLKDPSDEFCKFFVSRVYPGKATQKVKEQFYEITKRALNQYIKDKIREKLNTAFADDERDTVLEAESVSNVKTEKSKIETTEIEIEGYHIIKSILRKTVDPSRIIYRDAKTYFNVLLDDNNRKPICRLYFNTTQKYIATFDNNREEDKHPITDLNEIYNFAKQIESIISFYDDTTKEDKPD